MIVRLSGRDIVGAIAFAGLLSCMHLVASVYSALDVDGTSLAICAALIALLGAQALLITIRAFERDMLSFLAYLFHALFIGIPACAVLLSAHSDQPSVANVDWYVALAGVGAQLALGALVLRLPPTRVSCYLSPRLLAVVLMVCGAASLFKFALYFGQIGTLGSHLAIYTEGAAIRDAAPFWLRSIAAGVPLLGLLVFSQRESTRGVKALALCLFSIEFLTGIRGRPLFLFAGAVVLQQAGSGQLGKGVRLSLIATLPIIVLGALAIGFARENYDMAWSPYLMVVANGIASTLDGAMTAFSVGVPASMVATQTQSLLAATSPDSIDTVAKAISIAANPDAYWVGYGVSSSVLVELGLLISRDFLVFVYPIAAVLLVLLVRHLVASSSAFKFLLGAAILPALFYAWRAEIAQFVVYAIKALPFVLLLIGLRSVNMFPQRTDRRIGGAAVT